MLYLRHVQKKVEGRIHCSTLGFVTNGHCHLKKQWITLHLISFCLIWTVSSQKRVLENESINFNWWHISENIYTLKHEIGPIQLKLMTCWSRLLGLQDLCSVDIEATKYFRHPYLIFSSWKQTANRESLSAGKKKEITAKTSGSCLSFVFGGSTNAQHEFGDESTIGDAHIKF